MFLKSVFYELYTTIIIVFLSRPVDTSNTQYKTVVLWAPQDDIPVFNRHTDLIYTTIIGSIVNFIGFYIIVIFHNLKSISLCKCL